MFTTSKRTIRTTIICSTLLLTALLIGLASWRALKPAAAAPLTAFASCPAPQFQAPANFAAGNIPNGAAVGDFDLDGKQDVAIANYATNHITVLLGDGAGSLQAGVTYGVGNNAYAVAVGYFNADNKPDLVVTNQGSAFVSVLLGNGTSTNTFQPAVNYTTAQFANNLGVAVSDVNRDGKLDIVVAMFSPEAAAILLGNGDGTFQAATNYPAGMQPTAVVVGDFNRDGNQDLAVGNSQSNDLSLLKGNGDGTFQAQVTVGLGAILAPQHMVVGDFDADGKLDLVTANRFSNNLSVLRGNGDGTFAAATNISLLSGLTSVAVGDFNADGKQDLAVTNSGTFAGDFNVAILQGDGAGAFAARVNFGGMPDPPRYAAVGDFNGDGKHDLITANDPNTLGTASIFLNTCACAPPDVTTTAPAQVCASSVGNTISVPAGGTSYTWTNYGFNGAITSATNTPSITFTAGATGTMTLGVTVTNAGGCTASKLIYVPISPVPTLGNYTSPGTLSTGGSATVTPDAPPNQSNTISSVTVSAPGFAGSLSVSRATGVVTVSNASPPGSYTVTVTATNSSCGTSASKTFTLTVFGSCGSPQFGAPASFAAGNAPRSIAIADFDGDGKQDAAVANYQDNLVKILLGNGNGTFQTGVSYGAGQAAISIASGDFNGDGKQDLVTANYASNDISVLLGNVNGTFQAPVNYLPQTFHRQDVAVGDFNRDGKQDLAVANETGNNISVLLGNGDGTFQNDVLYGAGTGTFTDYLVIGDFNRDGNPDIVAANQSSNNLSVLLGNGNGTFQPAVNYGLGTALTPYHLALGDFNADGKLDITTANLNSNNISVVLGNGDGTFGAAANYPVAVQPGTVAVGDFNSDGKPDLAVGNGGNPSPDNNVAILLGNGDGTFQPRINFSGMTAYPIFVAVGDFNGDRRPDLITADDPNGPGNVSILLNTCACTPPDVTLTAPAQVCASSTGNTISIPSAGAGATYTWTNHSFSGAITGGAGTNAITFTAGATGTMTLGVTVTNAGGCTASKLIYIPINPLPTLESYGVLSGSVNVGASAFIPPFAPPSQSPTISSITVSAPSFTGSISVNPTSGVITISNAGPAGVHAVTVTATDNCGATATQMFSLTVNGAPTIAGQTISVLAGAGLTVKTIATVSDDLTPAGNLIVIPGPLPTGITLTGITNTGGTVTATVAADCSAAVGLNTPVVLTVTDGNGLTMTANLNITVTLQLYSATGGTADNFAGATEAATRRAAFSNAFPQPANPAWKRFDATTANRLLGYSFKTLPSNIVKAELIVRMKPQGAASADDSFNLGLVPPNTFAYTRAIASLPGTGGTWVSNLPVTFTLDLANLPGGGNLLAKIMTDKYLDVLIREDTAVDYMKLRYWTCPPAPMFRGTQLAAEGQATVAIAPSGSLLISNFGGSGNDGAAFNMGASLLSAGAGVSFVPDGGQIIETPGGELNLGISGQFGGIDQTLGIVKLKTALTANDKDTLSTDFGPLGVSSYLVQVYSGNTLVKTFIGSGQNIGYQNCTSLLAPTAKSIPGVDITTKRQPGAPPCPQARFTFGTCTQFDFGPGNGVSQGDMLVLTSTIEVSYTENCVLSEARVTGTNYGQFALSALNVIALNKFFETLGDAHIGAYGDTVTVSNIGSSGAAGLKHVKDWEGKQRVSVRLIPPVEPIVDGAYLQASMRGTLNGIPDQDLGRLRDTRSATGYVVTADFGALTPATRSLRLTNNGVSVIVVDGFNGAVDSSSSWNGVQKAKSNTSAPLTAANAASAARTKLGGQTSNTLTMGASYPANTVFKINGTDYVGDQLEFSAVGVNGTAIGDFSAFELTAADLPEFTITEVQTVPEDNPPTIAATTVSRQAGSPSASATIANVNDIEDAENTLVVKVNNATSATVNGVTVSGLGVDSAGVVTANVVAACGATNASFALTVTDSGGTPISASLDVSVNPNDPPLLTYGAQTVAAGGALSVSPTAGPTDNGSITTIAVQSLGTFTGTLTVDNTTGDVSISNAQPGGTHTITIRATDQCGTIRDASFTLGVGCNPITVNPPSLPNGFVGTLYTQPLSASGGTPSYTFTLNSGAFPNGLNIVGSNLTGMPTTTGVFNFSIKATDSLGCMGTRAYTVVISGTGLQFYPLAHPVRLLETRSGESGCIAPGVPITANTSLTVPARGTCDGLNIPANAAAVTGNVTSVNSGGGYLTIYPSDAAQPFVSNSNYTPNQILNNVFTVGLGAADGAFKIYVVTNTDVVVDITGYYAPPGAGGLFFHPLPAPVRLLETRAGEAVGCFRPGTPLLANQDFLQQGNGTCGIPSTALALVGNATTVSPQAGGYLNLFPADAARPFIASGNYLTNQILNSPFTVGLSPSGQFKVYTSAQTDLVIDVLGYYSADASDVNGAGLLFSPMTPARLLDTRLGEAACFTPGIPIPAATDTPQAARGVCTIPATAQAIVGNAAVVTPGLGGFLTFWPSNATRPFVASSNYVAGEILNRHFTVGLGLDGAFKIYTSTPTHLVIDVSGSFAP